MIFLVKENNETTSESARDMNNDVSESKARNSPKIIVRSNLRAKREEERKKNKEIEEIKKSIEEEDLRKMRRTVQ